MIIGFLWELKGSRKEPVNTDVWSINIKPFMYVNGRRLKTSVDEIFSTF